MFRTYGGIVEEVPGGVDDNGGFQHTVTYMYGSYIADYNNLPCKDCHYPPAVASPDTDTDDGLFPGNCHDCHWNYDAEYYDKNKGRR